ncbi:MAG: Hsp20/alpha crystallin family protein [Chloroflexota bacterium]|nr:Hsp20/alpha crystallin family protein [Chloroflexota bacterium]
MAEVSMVPVKSGNGKLRRAEPFGFLDDFEAEMERFWRRPSSFWSGPLLRPFRGVTPAAVTWAPRMDVYEKDNAIVIKAELPGLKKEDVDVEVEDEDLVIRGETKAESEVKEEHYYRSERSVGRFYRRMPLPAGVTSEQIQATLKDGVLEVRVPKPAEARSEAKKISVK